MEKSNAIICGTFQLVLGCPLNQENDDAGILAGLGDDSNCFKRNDLTSRLCALCNLGLSAGLSVTLARQSHAKFLSFRGRMRKDREMPGQQKSANTNSILTLLWSMRC